INAEKVRVTGNKAKQKVYYHHTGYMGGLKSINLEKMMQTHPTRVIEHAVEGMLPDNRLQARMMTRLRVHVGEAHPYQGQVKATSIKIEKEVEKENQGQ
ncbi:MAG: 50S ribosomal protein L13, partial [Dehalococcoidales bacterium]|nr:50S ribosomal protein L13 [Dehalococcoidales bacterium]